MLNKGTQQVWTLVSGKERVSKCLRKIIKILGNEVGHLAIFGVAPTRLDGGFLVVIWCLWVSYDPYRHHSSVSLAASKVNNGERSDQNWTTVIDLLKHGFEILPQKGQCATEPDRVLSARDVDHTGDDMRETREVGGPKHHTKECGRFLPPTARHGVARKSGALKPSHASSASCHGIHDRVRVPTASGCTLAFGRGDAGAGAADGDVPRPP
jgi:hypothetical protein